MKEDRKKRTKGLIGVIVKSDFLLEVVDARFPEMSRNKKLEELSRRFGKTFYLVMSKIDLVSEEYSQSLRQQYEAFFISTKTRDGIGQLRQFLAGKAGLLRDLKQNSRRNITVGVVGMPNTGKSSLINLLKGRHSARTSAMAGFTKGVQMVRMNEMVMLLDSAGIIPPGADETQLAFAHALNPEQVADPEKVALHILSYVYERNPLIIEDRYHVKGIKEGIKGIGEQRGLLGHIALHTGALKKGGIPDVEGASRKIILDWQRNRLRVW